MKYFEINEQNYEEQQKILKSFRNIISTHKFPPCFDVSCKSFDLEDSIILDSDSVLIGHNIVFDTVVSQREDYTFDKCLECSYFKEKKCKGIPNKKYMRNKETLMCRYGKQLYDRIAGDYKDGKFAYGSICNASCEFCFNRNNPEDIMPSVPLLNLSELKHFLYYVPNNIWYIGVTDHTKSGEFFAHPEHIRILNLIEPYVSGCGWIATNGLNLNETSVIALSKLNMPLSLSISALSEKQIRNNISSLPNYRKIFRLLRKHKVLFDIFTVPLKSNVIDGSLEDFVSYMVQHTTMRQISFLPPGYNRFTQKSIISELDFDNEKLLKYLWALKKKYIRIRFLDHQSFHPNELSQQNKNELKTQLSRIGFYKGSKLVLHSCSVDTIINTAAREAGLEKTIFLKVLPNTLGGNMEPAGMLFVDDYICALKRVKRKIDLIVVPSVSFNSHLQDIRLNSAVKIQEHAQVPLMIVKNFYNDKVY
jgi:hypothetical protein